MSLRNSISGVGVALITPFNADFSIDYPALERQINHTIDNGVDYLVSLGTTGETPTLSREERIAIVHFTFEKVNNRVPVVVGIGGNNTQAIIEDLKSFPLEQAIAVLSTAPYYSKPSQEGLFQHYKAIAAASPKPIILYNVPGRTGRNLEISTTLRLAEVPNIIGVKEASNNMAQGIQLLINRPKDFIVLSGDDDLAMPQMTAGFDGVISVAANAFPKEFSDMIHAALRGDLDIARKLNLQLFPSYLLMFVENNPAGVKSFLAHKGIIQNHLRLPLVPLSEKVDEQVKDYLENTVF